MEKKLRLVNKLWSRFLPGREAAIAFIFSFFMALQLTAQTRTVSGKVTAAEDGALLPGVNILIKGTTNGTTTGADGTFRLDANSEDVLSFSFIGYITSEVAVGQRTSFDIALQTDVAALEEVVVVGYGTVKKTDLTGSVSVVDAGELLKMPSPDVTQMLQGRVPGVAIISDGQPGASPNIRIRGISSFGIGGTSAEPLYVVDGLPLGPPTSSSGGDGAQPASTISSIRDINPNDIESVQVLKDASAGAIYGVRAANGVVIITTKKGRLNQALKVDFSMYSGIQNVSKTIPVLHRVQYQEINRETFTNAGQAGAIPPGNDPANANFISTTDTDWQKSGLKQGGIQNYNIGFSGGSATTSYYTSLDYFKNSGTLVGNGPDYERTSIRVNSDTKKGKFKFGENIYVSRSNETSALRVSAIPGANPPFINDLIWSTPTIPIYDPTREGGYGGSSSVQNALSLNIIGLNSLVQNKREITRALVGAFAEYEFFKGLTYRINGQYDLTLQNDELFVPQYDLGFFYTNGSASFQKINTTRTSGLLENTLAFKKTINKHNLNILGGVTYQDFRSNLMQGRTSGLPKPYIPTLSNGTGTKTISQFIDNSSIFSLLARFDYNYDDRYFITANVRRDESSKFSQSLRSVVFPSVAVAWKVSHDIKMPSFIRELKLRAGTGQLGNQNIPNYGFAATLNPNIKYSFNDSQVFGSAAISVVDPNLKWEVRSSSSVGIDVGLFKSLDLTIEYYNNTAKDIIVPVNLPLTSGAIPSSLLTNGGSMTNTGIELSINYRKSFGDLDIVISPNFYTVSNNVTQLGQGNSNLSGNNSRTEVGGSFGRQYGWVYEGIFQSASDVTSHAKQSSGTGPGDIKFKDLNNDGVIDDKDRTFIGQSLPTAYYGLNLSANYKNFDFTLFASGSGGAVAVNNQYQALMSSQSSGNTNYHSDILNRWAPTNTNTDIPRMIFLDPNLNWRPSDRPGWLQSTAYFRINTISLGYSLPRTLLDKMHMTKARIYVTTQNLYTFSSYKGFNPDFQAINPLAPGWDFGSYPRPVTYMMGLQVSF
jgi:TonB-dependent starch-binding outer membrane protein SusC